MDPERLVKSIPEVRVLRAICALLASILLIDEVADEVDPDPAAGPPAISFLRCGEKAATYLYQASKRPVVQLTAKPLFKNPPGSHP